MMKRLALFLPILIFSLAAFSQVAKEQPTKTKKTPLFAVLDLRGIKFADSKMSPAVFATVGASFKNSMSIGFGAGYFKNSVYDGSNVPVFLELSVLPLKKKVNPYIAAKVGANNYFPSSEGDGYINYKADLFGEISGGIMLKVSKRQGIILHGSYTTYNINGKSSYLSNNIKATNHGFSIGLGLKF